MCREFSYVAGGLPKCFDPDVVDATQAENGYRRAHLPIDFLDNSRSVVPIN